MNETFRSKRYVINEDESFCGLNDNNKREETERLINDFKFRTKRETINNNNSERTCCYIYIRVDPTLWDIVYKNEGLNVRKNYFSYIFINEFLNRKKNQLFMHLLHFYIEL